MGERSHDHGVERARRRAAVAPKPDRGFSAVQSEVLHLQRSVGNRAVSGVIQRMDPPEEEKKEFGSSKEVRERLSWNRQRSGAQSEGSRPNQYANNPYSNDNYANRPRNDQLDANLGEERRS